MNLKTIPLSVQPLVQKLERLSRRASIQELKSWLAESKVSREDLCDFVKFGETYCRNLIVRDENFELLCICWKPRQSSTIHDHANSTCGVCVISGELNETIFQPLDDGTVASDECHSYLRGSVCASQDADIHQIVNASETDELITLHIYSPPLGDMCSYKECSSRR